MQKLHAQVNIIFSLKEISNILRLHVVYWFSYFLYFYKKDINSLLMFISNSDSLDWFEKEKHTSELYSSECTNLNSSSQGKTLQKGLSQPNNLD